MSFKELVANDIKAVFLNADEHAESRTVIYDSEIYENIPVILEGLEEKDRRQLVTGSDHAQGLFLVSTIMHCAPSDLGGNVPEKGMLIKISEGTAFFRSFYVASSICELGMVRAELEAIDE